MTDTRQMYHCTTPECQNHATPQDRDRFVHFWTAALQQRGVNTIGGPIPNPNYCSSCLDRMGVPK